MDTTLQFVLVGAWLYCVLRLEKIAYDLKKLDLSQQFSYGDEGLNVRTLDITTEDSHCDHIYFPVSDGEGGYTGQQCSICGKFNSSESVLRPKIDHPGVDR